MVRNSGPLIFQSQIKLTESIVLYDIVLQRYKDYKIRIRRKASIYCALSVFLEEQFYIYLIEKDILSNRYKRN